MSATIQSLGVTIPGSVVRKIDRKADTTTLVIDQEQARALYDQLAPVLSFFDSQPPGPGCEVVDAPVKP